jgi:HAD superfamily hydrolase (TIGR01509 family)
MNFTWADLNQFDLFLFDMDGTLVNTEPLHAKAMEIALTEAGLKLPITAEESTERFAGMTDAMVLDVLFPGMQQTHIVNLIAQKNYLLGKVFRELPSTEKAELMTSGLDTFLVKLKTEKKALAVVSASEDSVVDATLDAFGLTHHFNFHMGRGKTARTKPFPDPYIEAMNRAGIPRERTLIFEDSMTGMASAISSGAQVIKVAPFSSQDGLKSFYLPV